MSEAPVTVPFESAGPLDAMQRLAGWTAALSGWRRHAAALLLGALAALALPPFDLAPLLVVAFSGLVWLAGAVRRPRQAFLLGWIFGVGFLVAGLYWIAIALLVDIAAFWWLFPVAIVAVPSGLAIFTGLALVAYHALRPRGLGRPVALAATWTALEWLRGHVLTGFPWNLAGYAWSGGFPGATAVLQTTALIGIYGLSLVTVLAAALPATLGDPPLGPGGRWRRFAPAVAAPILVAALAAGGALRLAGATDTLVAGVQLRLVQPSIPQSLKWDPAAREANFRGLLALSAGPGAERASAIIWPEVAATYFLDRDEPHRAAIARVAPPGGLVLSGALRTDAAPEPPRHVWNSLFVIDGGGAISGVYDKFHLVPFGEYVPFRTVLPLPAIAAEGVDFSAGPGPQTLALPGLPPVGPLICYEVIFPGRVVDPAQRPGWLLNVTNDAWYGFSSGPFQHFAIARVRAVEQGLALVRVANNGISGVIDPHGRVRARLGLDDVGVLDSGLPAPLAPTVYAQYGDSPFWGLMLVFIVPLLGKTRAARNRHAK